MTRLKIPFRRWTTTGVYAIRLLLCTTRGQPDEMDKAKILNIEKQGRKILIQVESEENYCYISMMKHQAQKLADLLIG